MPEKFGFYDLDVWRKSIAYAQEIYRASEGFPKEERFGLTSQIRRAAVSISSNIAEGSGRRSTVEHRRFIEIAYGSVVETVSQTCIALKLGFIDRKAFDEITLAAEEIAKMLSGLRQGIKKRGKQ